MTEKINYPNSELHRKIINEYELLLEKSEGKHKLKHLTFLAEKYGYSCHQSVSTMMRNYKKKQARYEKPTPVKKSLLQRLKKKFINILYIK